MKRYLQAALAVLALASSAAVQASREFSGIAPSGAWYHLEIPDGWNAGDALVLFQHGLDFTDATNPPGLGPLRSLMLDEGYAIAATSYRQRGWAMFTAIDDNRELLGIFEHQAGAPGEIIPFGGSLGGLVALKLAQAPGFPPVHATYALCPAAAGSRIWDAAIDTRLAYDVVCSGAGEFPRGAQPLPWAFDLGAIPDDLGNLFDQAQVLQTLLPLERCTGVNLPPILRNDAMQARLDRLLAFTHITDEDFLVSNVAYSTYVLSDLIRAPDKLGGSNPFTTVGVDYGSDAAIDADIARIQADPQAAARLRAASDLSGAVGDAKVISMHTSRDQLVIPSNQEFVRRAVPADQLVSAIVDEDTPTHCGFSDAEGVAGWESLRTWKAGGAQPGVADLQALCERLSVDGTVAGPCRFDPAARVPAFDSVVRPRPPLSALPGHPPLRAPPIGSTGPRIRLAKPVRSP